jgi:nitrite reductase/ring-hydroxylating ferredoxin subunit
MNKYGMVLSDIGLRPVFNTFLHETFRPLGAKLFGDDMHRVASINGVDIGTEDWGGSTLDSHHTFIVEYKPDGDRHLDMHIDSCDVTFNFGITASDTFEGSDLTFCGMFHNDDHRLHHFSYRHSRGRCVVHSGKRRHGARDIEKGERSSLVMWTHSEAFQRTALYEERHCRMVKDGLFDKVCLSYTHDSDYKKLMPQRQQFHMKSQQEIESDPGSTDSSSTRAPLMQKQWVVICKNKEVLEGQAKMRSFERENEQVAVFRHRGELFAMDNRCAHMGGPLCEGDIEDLGAHKKSKPANWKDGVVRCPRHGMCFNIRTGENINGAPFGKAGYGKQKLYPVRLSGDGHDIEVEILLEVDDAL